MTGRSKVVREVLAGRIGVRDELAESRGGDPDQGQAEDQDSTEHADSVGAQTLPGFVPVRLRRPPGLPLDRRSGKLQSRDAARIDHRRVILAVMRNGSL